MQGKMSHALMIALLARGLLMVTSTRTVDEAMILGMDNVSDVTAVQSHGKGIMDNLIVKAMKSLRPEGNFVPATGCLSGTNEMSQTDRELRFYNMYMASKDEVLQKNGELEASYILEQALRIDYHTRRFSACVPQEVLTEMLPSTMAKISLYLPRNPEIKSYMETSGCNILLPKDFRKISVPEEASKLIFGEKCDFSAKISGIPMFGILRQVLLAALRKSNKGKDSLSEGMSDSEARPLAEAIDSAEVTEEEEHKVVEALHSVVKKLDEEKEEEPSTQMSLVEMSQQVNGKAAAALGAIGAKTASHLVKSILTMERRGLWLFVGVVLGIIIGFYSLYAAIVGYMCFKYELGCDINIL